MTSLSLVELEVFFDSELFVALAFEPLREMGGLGDLDGDFPLLTEIFEFFLELAILGLDDLLDMLGLLLGLFALEALLGLAFLFGLTDVVP